MAEVKKVKKEQLNDEELKIVDGGVSGNDFRRIEQ
jgi:hypothetical protein